LSALQNTNIVFVSLGITLWDSDDLKRHIQERPQRHNTFEVDASDSTEGQFSSLNVYGSLKASYMLDMIKVEGSGKYLEHKKTSTNQCQLTLAYKVTTKVQELSMEHLGQNNLKHKEQVEGTPATHVVTAVLYGAQAFFVFEQEASQSENDQDIQIEGKAKLFFIKVEASMKRKFKNIINAEKSVCTFYGDFKLEKTPRTFQDAMQVYQSLPSLLGPNGENVVPIKVWMLPLSSLNVAAPGFCVTFNQSNRWFLQLIQSVMDDFSKLEMRCRDLLAVTGSQFPQMRKKLEGFKEMCSTLKVEYQHFLKEKLILLRRGRQKEENTEESLQSRNEFPFNISNLGEWVNFTEQEISVLKLFAETGKNINILKSQIHLSEETGEKRSKTLKKQVCFIFTSLGEVDTYMQTFSNCLKVNRGERQQICERTKEPWFTSREAKKKMWTKAKLFHDFAEANKENKEM
ncbi:PREDICTED: neoverrucotoxin subunit beta-like, partial [Poecilia mexicana]|uniref:neoverrucotoxin subunit beta-like n=1 Tax=Poecilia mexicana TaxID=48701 RepID=UPI00072E120B